MYSYSFEEKANGWIQKDQNDFFLSSLLKWLMQNPLSLLGLVKLCFLCCKLACIVPSTLTQLTFAPPQIQHIFQTKIQFFYNINFFGILILVLLFSLRLFYSRKKHFPNECPCPWQALSPMSQKRILHFLLNVEILHILVLMIGHKSRRRFATWFVVLHFCINLLIRGLFGLLPFSPAGQTLSSCSSSHIGTSWKFQIYKQRNWCYWRRLTYQWCCWRHCCQRLSVTQIGRWGKICRWIPGRSSRGGRCPCHDGLGLLDGALPCSQVRTSPRSKVSFPNPLVHFLSPHCSMLRHHTSRAPSLSPTPLPGRYLCVYFISWKKRYILG